MKTVFHLSLILCLSISFIDLQATHIRGGEIVVKSVPGQPLTVEIKVVMYSDEDSQVRVGGGRILTGDGNSYDGPFTSTEEQLDANTKRIWFTINHTFQTASAAGYLISYEEDFRNDYVININNGFSSQIQFYVETLFVFDPFLGQNSTPYFSVPPFERGVVGKVYRHKPTAFDPDGDLLTYRLAEVKRAKSTVVEGYQELNKSDFYTNYSIGNETGNGEPTLTIDRFTGEILWDAPGDVTNQEDPPDCEKKAEYNLALIVDEWRKVQGSWHKMGYVTRDFQIIVCNECHTNPPENSPNDTCIVAGEVLGKRISRIASGVPHLNVFGIPFEIGANKHYVNDTLQVSWATNCTQIRMEPYQFYYRFSGSGCCIDKIWNVSIIAPEVTGLGQEDQADGSVKLSWDAYSCPNADSMEIWRKDGDYTGDLCELQDPEILDFSLIGRIPIDQLAFTDTQIPTGKTSTDFTYHLSATFSTDEASEELHEVLTSVRDRKSDIKIYPNPSQGVVYIDSPQPLSQYNLYDMTGRLIQSGHVNIPGVIDNLKQVHGGTYIMVLLDQKDNVVSQSRLIIEKE